jgi:2-oxoisovalerate ferredoxin oxidoreductase beta subunit
MSTTVQFSVPEAFYDEFERKDGPQWTTHYCPGCGHGQVHKFIAEAIDDFGMQDKTIFISPVGCSVFAYYYFDVGNVQVPHGRCPAAGTGIKRAHPESLVIGYQGDGDLAAIGGNEIMQAANRGENITIFFINNAIYGMTGGQMAPTSLIGMQTATSPAGRSAANEGFPIKVCELLNTLDAPYYLERVALGDPKHNRKTRAAVRKAIQYQLDNKGFTLVEVLSPCPTGWKMTSVDAAKWTIERLTQVFPLGVFRNGHELDLGHPRIREQVPLEKFPDLLETNLVRGDIALPDKNVAIETASYKFAGFGGQGVLLLGMLMANAGMLAGRQVSWIPSYGPEMRGGTANCGVTISDEEIGSPLIQNPTVLVAMNGPSLERFGGDVVSGGSVYYNSSMINEAPKRSDVTSIPVPANEIAEGLGNPRVANMVVLGAVLGGDCAVSKEAVLAALPQVIKSQPELLDLNRKAIEAGMDAVSVAS